MSASYASRLKHYPNKGACGLPEIPDTERQITTKVKRIATLVETSKRIVILTGAGVSTSSGIPDFRGPNGVWTLEKLARKKRKRLQEPVVEIDFSKAQPSITHKAISRLVTDGRVAFCVTQNVDGLHQRSGLSRNHLAVLHGCAFTERCETCQTEMFNDNEVKGISFQKTGNTCPKCGGDFRDTLLDWEDPLPELDWDRASKECGGADLILCLGTSLRIEPAASLAIQANRLVIVNLQVTPYDDNATMLVRGKVDDIMSNLMIQLGYESSWLDDPMPSVERTWSQV
jgi:mono-ADP-ribosyltransferase sirtuin 6